MRIIKTPAHLLPLPSFKPPAGLSTVLFPLFQMRQTISDAQDSVVLEPYLLGTFISAIAYGIVIVLSGNCILLIQKNWASYPKRTRRFLAIYVTVMLLLSTETIIQSIWLLSSSLFQGKALPFIGRSPPAIPVTIWGADGIMVSLILLHQNKDFHGIAPTDMALCHLVSGCSQTPQDSFDCLAFTPLSHFVR